MSNVAQVACGMGLMIGPPVGGILYGHDNLGRSMPFLVRPQSTSLTFRAQLRPCSPSVTRRRPAGPPARACQRPASPAAPHAPLARLAARRWWAACPFHACCSSPSCSRPISGSCRRTHAPSHPRPTERRAAPSLSPLCFLKGTPASLKVAHLRRHCPFFFAHLSSVFFLISSRRSLER